MKDFYLIPCKFSEGVPIEYSYKIIPCGRYYKIKQAFIYDRAAVLSALSQTRHILSKSSISFRSLSDAALFYKLINKKGVYYATVCRN